MGNFDLVHLLMFVIGCGFGVAVIWGFYRSSAKELLQARTDVEGLREEKDERMREESRLLAREKELETLLEEQRKGGEDRQQFLEEAQEILSDTFKALSAQALESSQESFLRLAKSNLEKYQEIAKGDLEKRQQAIGELVKPVNESLGKVDEKIHQLEKQRQGAYAELKQQVLHMAETQKGLQRETGNLVKALRRPTGRGQWGEMQLKRVVEMAGMQEHCDFKTQTTTEDDEGRRLRPDMIVSLPGGKKIVVDSKTPMDAYLDAIEARERGDETAAKSAMARHSQQVATHIRQLSSKGYQDQFDPTPEFVVLFLPSESFFSDALAQDPGLIEQGVDQGVILATPTTLIALLRAVSYGWRQESLTQNAREISELGRTLYDRLSVMTRHLSKLGRNIDGAAKAYNEVLGTVERRVLVTARKFKELEVAPANSELESPAPIEVMTRDLQAPELFDYGDGTGNDPPSLRSGAASEGEDPPRSGVASEVEDPPSASEGEGGEGEDEGGEPPAQRELLVPAPGEEATD